MSTAITANDGFDPNVGPPNGFVHVATVQADGKIVIGGWFNNVGGVTRNNIARLNSDGSVDNTFNTNNDNPNINQQVQAICLLPDGKIIIGGSFTSVGGVARNRIARLNADGSLDPTFAPSANDAVLSITVQNDGKIIIGGSFSSVNGINRNKIARLNGDGTLDSGFDPNPDNAIIATALQPDGKILVGGIFTSVGGVTRNRIARLNSDGSLDGSFNPDVSGTTIPSWSSSVRAISVQPDGIVVIGGNFTNVSGVTRNCMARFFADGSLDPSFNPNVNYEVDSIALQPNGKIVIGGQFNYVSQVYRMAIARLNLDGSLDTTFISPSYNVNSVDVVAIQADGKILIGGSFLSVDYTARNHIARLNEDGSLETTFVQTTNYSVDSTVLQPDGKTIVSGYFGVAGGWPRTGIARLNRNGTLDETFNPVVNSEILTTTMQPDGKILIGGFFTTVFGNVHNRLARLNANGTIDDTFNSDANDAVYTTAVQNDGRIVIGGAFTSIGGVTRNRLARLNSDGTLDSTFNPNANNEVHAFYVLADGKILVSGDFTSIGGIARNYIARLNADGTLDSSFNPNANNCVNSTAVQPDGKIVIGGAFTTIGGVSRNRIARLNADGSLDTSFNPNASDPVWPIALQTDGRIVIGGWFNSVGGITRNRIARLTADGSLDTTFDPGADQDVYSINVQTDGKILIGGPFSIVDGLARGNLARLSNSDAALQALSVAADGTSIAWMRSGASPEVDRVTFEISDDMLNWTLLGRGTRTSGGWQLASLSLPTGKNIYLRARGIVNSGIYNGSGSIVESVKLLHFPLKAPEAMSATAIQSSGFTATWIATSGANGYYLDVATDSGFTNFVSGYNNRSVGNVSSFVITDLTAGTSYYYRVRAYNAGCSSNNSSTITVTTLTPTATLNITISGPGTVTSQNQNGTNYSCNTTGTCQPVTFGYNDQVTLNATGSNSTFSGWSDDISGSTNPYPNLPMDGNKNIIATFAPDPATVRIDGSATSYYSIGLALNACAQDATIRARDLIFAGNVPMNTDHTLKLLGGFPDASFADGSQSGYSTIGGTLIIRTGKLVVARVKVRP